MIDPNAPDYENNPASSKRPGYHYLPANIKASPVVSIITPFYNTGAVFLETETSLLRQTFQQWEWLIINDGSTSAESLEILDSFRNHHDPRIKVIDQPKNTGPSGSRNLGVSLAATEYLYLLDSDDLIEPTTLEKCFWYLESYSDCSWVNGWSVGFGSENYFWKHGYHCTDKFLEENLVTGRTMIRKCVFKDVGGYNEEIRDGYEDWDLWLKAASKGYWGHTMPEVFDWYRRRSDHWSRWATIHQKERMEKFRASLRIRYPKLFKSEFPKWAEPWPKPFEEFRDLPESPNILSQTGKHIVLILPWLNVGGADKFNLDLVKLLSQRDWKITIITTKKSDHPWTHAFAEFTPDIFHLDNLTRPIDQPLCIRCLIQSRRPDAVVISGSELAYWILPYLKYHCPKTAFLDYIHIEEDYWKNGGYARYASRSSDYLTLNLVSSEHLQRWIKEHGHANPEQIRTVYTNIDADYWKPDSQIRKLVRNRERIKEDLPVIMFAGRLSSQKQPEVLTGVAINLFKANIDFHLWIAGDGADKEWMEKQFQAVGMMDRVSFLGNIGLANIRERMQAADIFFLPSLWEGIALSVYEAMSSGLPIVGARVGGQSELVSEDCGILLETKGKNPADQKMDYTEILKNLLIDSNERSRLGLVSRERILNHFTLDKMVDAVESHINEAKLLNQNAKRSIPHSFAYESAVRAIEYFRIEKVADELWQNRFKSSEPSRQVVHASGFEQDTYRYWVHLHRHIPMIVYRWWYIGWPNYQARKLIGIPVHKAYDESLSLSERLEHLTMTGMYDLLQSLRKFRILRGMLPKPYSNQR